jgi:hypothetical protein
MKVETGVENLTSAPCCVALVSVSRAESIPLLLLAKTPAPEVKALSHVSMKELSLAL